MAEEEVKVPGWVLTLLAFLSVTPIAPTIKEVQAALLDGTVTVPEIGHILRQAAANAAPLIPGDAPEEQLAVDVTNALATYLDLKFPSPPVEA